MRHIEISDLDNALREVGVTDGDILYLQTDLRAPGLIRGVRTKADFCGTYLQAIQRAIGGRGTIVVPTFTPQVARYDEDFIWEETPTTLGLLPEFIRARPESLRSLHPLHSVTALGPDRERICGDNTPTDFGWGSPYHRMLEANARILTIGVSPSFAVAIANFLEAMCCLPYNYNKLLKWRPVVGGKRLDQFFYANARHLHLNTRHILRHFASSAEQAGLIRRVAYGDSTIQLSNIADVFNFGLEFLKREPYGLLEEPPLFEYGVLPFDGPTAGRDGVS